MLAIWLLFKLQANPQYEACLALNGNIPICAFPLNGYPVLNENSNETIAIFPFFTTYPLVPVFVLSTVPTNSISPVSKVVKLWLFPFCALFISF